MLPLSYAMQSHFNRGLSASFHLLSGKCGEYGKGCRCHVKMLDLKEKVVKSQLIRSGRSISYKNHPQNALATPDVSLVRTAEKESAYRFRTEVGDQLKVLVKKKKDKYGLYVEIIPLQLSKGDGELHMSWGLFRSDSTSFMPLDYGKQSTVETPFMKDTFGRLAVELDFDSSLAPFYISFLLKSEQCHNIRSHRKTNFVVPVGFGSGSPLPLGISFLYDGSINFAFFSKNAASVVLCLFTDSKAKKPALEIDLDPYVNRSGDIWHALIDGSVPFESYGYHCNSSTEKNGTHVLLDPYAKVIEDFGSGRPQQCLGKICQEPTFDWSGDLHPSLPMEQLIIYRLNVTRFTKDKSSMLSGDIAGSFSGISEKIHYFKDLGVNAILLEPIFLFDEQKGPYFPCHFFSVGSSYESSGDSRNVAKSMKEMVKKLHSSGIEVLLEVIYTHTSEGSALIDIDYASYYQANGEDLKSMNLLNCSNHIVQQMILESLRRWVIEFRIDGFCFINASSLIKGTHGEFLSRPPLIEAISFDPILSKVKIIADNWDPHELATEEVTFPHWKRWAEMNTKFCVDVRNFLRGQGIISNLATRLCGSGDLFSGGRGPAFSFNFITRNVGFTLVDLVSFSSGEVSSQLSWNCGEEGPTNKTAVLETRLKQIRNFLFVLFISLGVPVLNMGDEFGQSSGGSITYADRKHLDWNALRSGFGIQVTQFISFLSTLRVRRSDLLQRRCFLQEENIDWRGPQESPPRWDDPSCKFLAMTLKVNPALDSVSPSGVGDLFVAFNGADHPEEVTLPPLAIDVNWVCLVDTALQYPGFFTPDGFPLEAGALTYVMKSHSCILFEARSL